ncbi:MAG: outer membrane protein transport protein [Dokdonella sp.]|uniref:OmpP1/FadL family transporter n=1 Tax=Dokdonella sp. TaxID=2291710 RepID=UPI003263C51F
MHRENRRTWIAPALAVLPLALVAALAGRDAMASGFQLKENSVQGLGRAYAGESSAPGDCAVVVNNPAAIGDIGGANCAQVDLNVINFKTEFKGSGTDFLGTPLSGGNGGDGGVTKPVPAMYFTHKLNDQWAFGASVGAPFGFQTEYDDRSVVRYEGVKSKLESLDLTFAASYKINDQFSIGGSIIAQRTSAELNQAIDFGTILAGPTNGAVLPQEADGFGGLKGDDWGYGFDIGLLWKPTSSDRIGFNYHSQIDHRLSGDAKFYVPSNILPLLGGAFVNQHGEADFDTPWFVSGSWWHNVDDRLSFGADIAFTHWSSFKQLKIDYSVPAQDRFAAAQPFNWEDTWFYSVGGEYRLDDAWTLRAGLAYDQTPTVDSTRTPRVPDGNRTWVSVGLGYKMSESTRFDLGFVHLFVDDGKIDNETATFNSLNGKFESKGNVLGISGQYLF